MTTARQTVALVLVLWAALLVYGIVRVPAITSVAAAIMVLGCAVTAWLVWPRKRAVS